MRKNGIESGPDVLDQRGLGNDGIQHSNGLGPVPAAAEPRELEALVGRGSHRHFLPAYGRGRSPNSPPRSPARQRAEREGRERRGG